MEVLTGRNWWSLIRGIEMIRWVSFPKYRKIEVHMREIINVFEVAYSKISSEEHTKISNEVLSIVAGGLVRLGYSVEQGKKKNQKIHVPVSYGECGKPVLSFDADAYNEELRTVIEVEAGRAVVNYQFLKDFYEACLMQNVDYLCIAVRNQYKNNCDFQKVCDFFDALYMTNRMQIPLKSIVIIGY